MTEKQKRILHLVEGRIEGFAAGYSIEGNQYEFLMDTAELIKNLLIKEELDA